VSAPFSFVDSHVQQSLHWWKKRKLMPLQRWRGFDLCGEVSEEYLHITQIHQEQGNEGDIWGWAFNLHYTGLSFFVILLMWK